MAAAHAASGLSAATACSLGRKALALRRRMGATSMSRELDLPQTGKGGNIVNVLIEQPLVPVRGDKRIVTQVRVGGADTVNLLALARAETLARVEAPEALE